VTKHSQGLITAAVFIIGLAPLGFAADSPATGAPGSLIEMFAPQLMHPRDEPNLPTNVDWFIRKTSLTFHNSSCPQDDKVFGAASFDLLETSSVTSACGGHKFRASGTRSAGRSRTFLLSDVADNYKTGSSNPAEWDTYYHSYRNADGGWTIQYWSFYAFNTGKKLGPIEVGSHGGDWEMVSVVLGVDNLPVRLRATGHKDLQSTLWASVQRIGTHPIVYTEKGGHEADATPPGGPPYIVHPTWSGSMAVVPGSPDRLVGRLVDLGTKLHPSVRFLDYSGLWGSLGATPYSSGYWGPVFNETSMKPDGFLAAWCDGIAATQLADNGHRECYADDVQ
jgi:hypothetical protein